MRSNRSKIDAFRRALHAVNANAVETVIGTFLAERAGVGPSPASDDDQHKPPRDAPPDESIMRALGVDSNGPGHARTLRGSPPTLLGCS